MKKIFVLMSVALMGAMSMNAQNVADLEAKKAKVESQLKNYDDGIAKKWEFRFDLGYGTNFVSGKGNDGILPGEESSKINVGVGYNVNSNWYLGLASGFFYNMGGIENSMIPMLADVTYRHNYANEKWSFVVEGRGGFVLGNGETERAGKNITNPNAWMIDIQPGFYYRVKKNIDLKFTLGYMHLNDNGDGANLMKNSNSLVAKVGMNFRKASKMPYRSELEEMYKDLDRQLRAASKVEAPKTQPAKPEVTPAPTPVETVNEAQKAEKEGLIIFYEKRESELNLENHAAVKKVAEWAKVNPSGKIVVKSYADKGTGNAELNVNYAKQRAEKVLNTLVKLGVDKNMIEVSSYGDTVQPFEENDKNRCSIFELIP